MWDFSGANQRKHQSFASLAFVWWIHRSMVNSPHKGPMTRKMFPFDDVIMYDIASTSKVPIDNNDLFGWIEWCLLIIKKVWIINSQRKFVDNNLALYSVLYLVVAGINYAGSLITKFGPINRQNQHFKAKLSRFSVIVWTYCMVCNK